MRKLKILNLIISMITLLFLTAIGSSALAVSNEVAPGLNSNTLALSPSLSLAQVPVSFTGGKSIVGLLENNGCPGAGQVYVFVQAGTDEWPDEVMGRNYQWDAGFIVSSRGPVNTANESTGSMRVIALDDGNILLSEITGASGNAESYVTRHRFAALNVVSCQYSERETISVV